MEVYILTTLPDRLFDPEVYKTFIEVIGAAAKKTNIITEEDLEWRTPDDGYTFSAFSENLRTWLIINKTTLGN